MKYIIRLIESLIQLHFQVRQQQFRRINPRYATFLSHDASLIYVPGNHKDMDKGGMII